MTYSPVNLTLTESQIQKLKSGRANEEPVTLQINKSQHGGPHTLLLTNTQIKRLNSSKSARITFSKRQLKSQTGGFLGPLISLGAKLIPKILPTLGHLGTSALGGVFHELGRKATSGKGIVRAGEGITLHVPKEDIELIINICKCMEEQGDLPSGSTAEALTQLNEQSGGFLGTLLATLAGSVLPSVIGSITRGIRGKGIVRAGDYFKKSP